MRFRKGKKSSPMTSECFECIGSLDIDVRPTRGKVIPLIESYGQIVEVELHCTEEPAVVGTVAGMVMLHTVAEVVEHIDRVDQHRLEVGRKQLEAVEHRTAELHMAVVPVGRTPDYTVEHMAAVVVDIVVGLALAVGHRRAAVEGMHIGSVAFAQLVLVVVIETVEVVVVRKRFAPVPLAVVRLSHLEQQHLQ